MDYKKLILILLLHWSLYSFSQNLKIVLLNYDDTEQKWIYYSSKDSEKKYINDSLLLSKGYGETSLDILEPKKITLYRDRNYSMGEGDFYNFYLEPNGNTVFFDSQNPSLSHTEPTKSNQDYQKYLKFKENNDIAFIKLAKQYDSIRQANEDESNKEKLNTITAKLNSLATILKKNDVFLDIKYASENPDSFIILDELLTKIKRKESRENIDLIENAFESMTTNIKTSYEGNRLKKAIINFKKSLSGSPSPDFKAYDINNLLITLSHFNEGKYILLDFWASWCKPCREDIPYLQHLYNRYKKDNLQIISISIDEKVKLWKNAIDKDNTGHWIHIISNRQYNKGIAEAFSVSSIPVKILLDRNGMIVNRWIGGGNEIIDDIERNINLLTSSSWKH